MKEYDRFIACVSELEAYTRIWKRLDFDRQCCTPGKGLSCCADDTARISAKIHELRCSPSFVEIMERCYSRMDELEPVQRAALRYHYSLYQRENNHTPKFVSEFARATGAAFEGWMKAGIKNDYTLFQPYLARVIEMRRESIQNRDTEYAHIYDGCLSDYERGSTVKRMDAFFAELKEKLLPLPEQGGREPVENALFRVPVSIEQQKLLSLYILEAEGLNPEQFFFTETEHPFTQFLCRDDVRVATHFKKNDFISNIYTVLHEGGHAVHYTNLPEEFYKNGIADISTFGMQECISRFYENCIGRSRAFCEWIVSVIRRYYPKECGQITAEQLFAYVNAYRHQPIRMQADEASYCIHILIRYELEKGFMNGEISVEELPTLWNEKYRSYLGIEVRNDKEGILQDVHWTDSIGYFPSYALGSVAAAQLLARMNEDFNVYDAVRNGELRRITRWLIQNALIGSMSEDIFTWIREVTGRELSVDYFIKYLKEKQIR